DFNDLLAQEDKKGNHPHPNWLCNGFRSAVCDCDLTDIHLEGEPPNISFRSQSHFAPKLTNDKEWKNLLFSL
ncbi:endonuclease/exonuclease/phosphatase family protein, partial [Trifolium medium]|nr:endonuclease/exonuclease/phosphatase family protein [Trifolium medium]